MISLGIYKGETVLTGRPYFYLTGGAIGQWNLKKLEAKPGDDEMVVTITGAYDSLDIVYDVAIDGQGLITTKYTLGRFDVSIPKPRKIP